MSESSDFSSLLGTAELVRPDLSTISVADAIKEKSVIGLYFSAHWCGPCRNFTPKLATIYSDLQVLHASNATPGFQVIFVSSDTNTTAFASYLADMPWVALPFELREAKEALESKFECEGIPYLVLLDAATGAEITRDGRVAVTAHGSAGFPFTGAALEAQAVEEERKVLGALAGWDVFPAEEVAKTALTASKAVALFFGNATSNATHVAPKLAAAYSSGLAALLHVVYVPIDITAPEHESEFTAGFPTAWTKLSPAAATATMSAIQSATGSAVESPTLLVVSGDLTTIFNKNAARTVYREEAFGFPWSAAAMAAAQQEREAKAARVREEAKGLGFLSEAKIFGKDGRAIGEDGLTALRSCKLVGLYFSSHWCGPCRNFTPKLVAAYNQLHGGKSDLPLGPKNVEIVFISCDRTATDFAGYYSEMPWLALDYEDPAHLQPMLSSAFNADSIPTLVWIDPATGTIDEDGVGAVMAGVEYFPWTPELRAEGEAAASSRAEAAKLKRLEDTRVAQGVMAAAGTVVLRNHIGVAEIATDYEITLDGFQSVVGDIKLSNGRFYYEVEVLQLRLPQFGWATFGFSPAPQSQGNGIGDDAFSWGFDGVRQQKWHDGSEGFGGAWRNGDVIGFSADLFSAEGKATFAVSVNGSFEDPNGVGFEGVEAAWVAPALTGHGVYRINFGDHPFKFAAPDSSYSSVHAAERLAAPF